MLLPASNLPHEWSKYILSICSKPSSSSTVLFRRQQENPSSKCEGMPTQRLEEKRVEEREREREKKSSCTQGRKTERERFGSSFYMFLPPPGPALCKLGLARSAVSSIWSLHSGPWTFLWPSLFFQFSSVAQLCRTLCDPMNRSTPGLPVHHHLPEFTQTHV